MRAEGAAGEKVVAVANANVAHQGLDIGLLDEIRVDLVPALLGQGILFFANYPSVAVQQKQGFDTEWMVSVAGGLPRCSAKAPSRPFLYRVPTWSTDADGHLEAIVASLWFPQPLVGQPHGVLRPVA